MKRSLIFGLASLLFLSKSVGAVYPSTFGAIGNGATDDTVALQAACNVAASTNDVVNLGIASYLISQPVTANCDIIGVSEQKSVILLGNQAVNGLVVTTVNPVHFEKFKIRSVSQQIGGSAIVINAPGFPNSSSTFERLILDYVYTGFDFVSAAYWHINQCEVGAFLNIGIHVRDITGVDDGDSTITDSLVIGTPGQGTCILQESGGGLRITGCKLISAGFGYALNLAPGITTGALVITGCSIEGFLWAGVFFTEQGLGTFLDAVITGNEIGAGTGIEAQSPFGGIWLVALVISGNSIVPPNTGGMGIDLNGVTGASISGNSIWSNGGKTWGIVLRSATQLSYVGDNSLSDGITYPITNTGNQNQAQ